MKIPFYPSIIFILIASLVSTSLVYAQAWWGDGYRDPAWVLSRGGTIINFEIIGNGPNDGYKAVLEQGGKYIEGEIGKKGKFDDAKNGMYVVTAFKGGTDNRNAKSGKKISSITISANPGETITLVFDEKDKSVVFQTDRPKKDLRPRLPVPVHAEPEPDYTKPFVIPESVKKNWVIS